MWSCIACEKVNTSSATKLKAHLLGTPGFGEVACPDVSEDAEHATLAAEKEKAVFKA